MSGGGGVGAADIQRHDGTELNWVGVLLRYIRTNNVAAALL